MNTLYHAIILLFLFCNRIVESLECYNCSRIDNVNNCVSTTRCLDGQSCFLESSNSEYSLGCIANQRCGALAQAASLVGRSSDVFKRRDTQHCFECCGSDICNRYLCGHLKPTACIDDPKVDCALINSKFNICQITHEAKSVCPKFCGLCSLVDGNWADWSSWSNCDVSCENGTQSRFRQCTGPAPSNGGLDCLGDSVDNRTCSLSHCPIDGNWGNWASWSPCDVTCSNGTQTRTRTCNNPYPAYNGKNCSGDKIEYKQCMNNICPIHGGWTEWLPWEPCSVTCDIGIQRRHRNCTNPIPQNFGHFCYGETMDVKLCQPETCAITFRSVAFRSHTLTQVSLSSNSRIFVFTNVTLNAGNGYNKTTGIFTAPVAGMYSLSTQFCIGSASTNNMYYRIVQNGTPLLASFLCGNNANGECYQASVIAVVSISDRIWVEYEYGYGYLSQTERNWNMFSGFLLHS